MKRSTHDNNSSICVYNTRVVCVCSLHFSLTIYNCASIHRQRAFDWMLWQIGNRWLNWYQWASDRNKAKKTINYWICGDLLKHLPHLYYLSIFFGRLFFSLNLHSSIYCCCNKHSTNLSLHHLFFMLPPRHTFFRNYFKTMSKSIAQNAFYHAFGFINQPQQMTTQWMDVPIVWKTKKK